MLRLPTLAATALLMIAFVPASALPEATDGLPEPGPVLGQGLSQGLGASLGPADLEAAVRALYLAGGLVPPATIAAVPEPLASGLARLVLAHVAAGLQVEEAFAGLTAEERAALGRDLLAAEPQPTDAAGAARAAAVVGLLPKVDALKIRTAATALAGALRAFSDAARDEGYSVDQTTCVDPPACTIWVGDAANDVWTATHFQTAVIITDLGGNDQYVGSPATYLPGMPLALPTATITDVMGNDRYVTTATHPMHPDSAFGQGVGITGIGLIDDALGDDDYVARLQNEHSQCTPDYSTFFTHRQFLYAQGVGILGAGGIHDATGNDEYRANNEWIGNNWCHWGKVYTFAQGTSLHLGLGSLVDGLGDDVYNATSHAAYVDDNMAMTHAQGATHNGIAELADGSGSDVYEAWSYASFPPGNYAYRTKGAFAWTYAQGSVMKHQGHPFPGAPIVVPATGQAISQSQVCQLLNASSQCGGPGTATLYDTGFGRDRYLARAEAIEGPWCGWASNAVVSAQGSAGWSGYGALVDEGFNGPDRFELVSRAEGDGCWITGVRAHTYGQGYGGPLFWAFWEYTGPDQILGPGPFWTPPVGVLSSGGAEVSLYASTAAALTLANFAATGADTYVADATTKNGAGPACSWGTCPPSIAETWVQGSAGNLRDTWKPGIMPFGGATPPPMGLSHVQVAGVDAYVDAGVGLGIFTDVAGHDVRFANASAFGFYPNATTTAQGAAVSGIGAISDAGGMDRYNARASHNGVNQPLKTRAQAWAQGTWGQLSGCTGPPVVFCSSWQFTGTMALGVLLDVGGMDTYSEAAEGPPACQANQATWGNVVGNCTPTLPMISGTALGSDALSQV